MPSSKVSHGPKSDDANIVLYGLPEGTVEHEVDSLMNRLGSVALSVCLHIPKAEKYDPATKTLTKTYMAFVRLHDWSVPVALENLRAPVPFSNMKGISGSVRAELFCPKNQRKSSNVPNRSPTKLDNPELDTRTPVRKGMPSQWNRHSGTPTANNFGGIKARASIYEQSPRQSCIPRGSSTVYDVDRDQRASRESKGTGFLSTLDCLNGTDVHGGSKIGGPDSNLCTDGSSTLNVGVSMDFKHAEKNFAFRAVDLEAIAGVLKPEDADFLKEFGTFYEGMCSERASLRDKISTLENQLRKAYPAYFVSEFELEELLVCSEALAQKGKALDHVVQQQREELQQWNEKLSQLSSMKKS